MIAILNDVTDYQVQAILLTLSWFCGFRVLKVIGFKPPELLGKSVFDFFHPEDQARMRDSFDQGMHSYV